MLEARMRVFPFLLVPLSLILLAACPLQPPSQPQRVNFRKIGHEDPIRVVDAASDAPVTDVEIIPLFNGRPVGPPQRTGATGEAKSDFMFEPLVTLSTPPAPGEKLTFSFSKFGYEQLDVDGIDRTTSVPIVGAPHGTYRLKQLDRR